MTKDIIINTDELTQTRYNNMTLDLITDANLKDTNLTERSLASVKRFSQKIVNPYFSILFFIVFIILLMVVYGLLSYHHYNFFEKL